MKTKFFIERILIFALVVFLAALTANAQSNGKLSAPVNGLVDVIYPDLTSVEPSVTKQIKDAQIELNRNAQNKGISPVDLGNSYARTGMVYHAYSLDETAVQCYTNAASLQPNDYRWPHLLGLVKLRQNRTFEAIDDFKLASKLNPNFIPAFIKAGNAFVDVNLYALAEKEFVAVLRINPREPAALYGMGQIEYEKKNYAAAAELFEKVLKILPAANRVHYSAALAYRGSGEEVLARQHLALQGPVGVGVLDPLERAVEDLSDSVRANLLLAKAALESKRPEDAIRLYVKVLKKEPENLTALVNLGSAYMFTGNREQAATVFEKAIKTEPSNTNALFNLGALYSAAGKGELAILNFKKLLTLAPEDIEARFQLAKELSKTGSLDEAIKEYRTVADAAPEKEEVLIELVKLLDKKGFHKEVMERLRDAYETYPSRIWTGASYSYALAKSADPSLRQGELALEIAQKVYATTGQTEHGFVIVFALAELGRCKNAIEIGNGLVKKAQQEKDESLAASLVAEVQKLSGPGGCNERGK